MYRVFIASVLFISILLLGSCTTNKIDSNTERLTIASERADCTGVGLQKCLLIKKPGQADWEFFYGNIQGFEYTSGYEYVIEVRREVIQNTAADQSSFRYVLVKEISKTQKVSNDMPPLSRN